MDQSSTDQQWDQAVAERLAALRPAYRPESWDALSARLDDVAADRVFSDKIAALSPAADPAGWERLAAHLDAQLIDQTVAEKLGTLAPAADLAGWEKLAARMDAEADAAIAEKLSRVSVPNAPASGWAVLAERLELVATRIDCLTAIKFAEICLAFAALLLLWQFYPAAPVTRSATAQFAAKLPDLPAGKVPVFPGLRTTDPGAEEVSSLLPATGTDGLSTPSTKSRLDRLIDGTDFMPPIYRAPAPLLLPPLDLPVFKETLPPPTTAILAYEFRLDIPELNSGDLKITGPSRPKISFTLAASPFDLVQVITPGFEFDDSAPIDEAIFPRPTRLEEDPSGLSDDRRYFPRDVRYTRGWSVGANVNVTHKKHALQTGLHYSNRSYVPTLLYVMEETETPDQHFVNINRKAGYSRLTYNNLGLALNYQYTLRDNEKWRLYGMAGALLNISIKSTFYRHEGTQQAFDRLRQTAGGRTNRSIDLRELFNPDPGLLQGGSIFDNASLSAQLGMGLERVISKDGEFSVFTQPTLNRAVYYRQGAGMGPFADRVHSVQIWVGVRKGL